MPVDPASEQPAPVEDVLAALRGSETLALLGMTDEQLHEVRDDPHLLETLRITHELILVLRREDVLDTFSLLPGSAQANFVRRLGAPDSEDLRRHRTATFVDALRESPLSQGR